MCCWWKSKDPRHCRARCLAAPSVMGRCERSTTQASRGYCENDTQQDMIYYVHGDSSVLSAWSPFREVEPLEDSFLFFRGGRHSRAWNSRCQQGLAGWCPLHCRTYWAGGVHTICILCVCLRPRIPTCIYTFIAQWCCNSRAEKKNVFADYRACPRHIKRLCEVREEEDGLVDDEDCVSFGPPAEGGQMPPVHHTEANTSCHDECVAEAACSTEADSMVLESMVSDATCSKVTSLECQLLTM